MKWNRELLKAALQALDILPGDVVFIHSDVRALGLPDEVSDPAELLPFYYETIREQLGDHGTLCVPAYFYEYARFNTPFDAHVSPVSLSLGSLSSYIAGQPDAVRSLNPLQSIASVGAQAEAISGGGSLSGYGVTSPWHKIHNLNGKFVFLGVTLQPMTFVHYIEQQFGVPHLYFKVYNTPIYQNGEQVKGTPVSAVRYLDYSIEYDLASFEKELSDRKLLKKIALGRGEVRAVAAQDAFRIGIACLDQNPYFFLKRKPNFIPGKIPMDGPTGELVNELGKKDH